MKQPHKIDSRYAPPVTWTCISRPDDAHKTLVDEKGTLLYGYVGSFLRTVEITLFSGDAPVEVSQKTESASVPAVITTAHYPNATLEVIAFGHQHDGSKRTDIALWKVTARKNEFMASLRIDTNAREPDYKINDNKTRVDFAQSAFAKDLKGPQCLVASNRLRKVEPSRYGPDLSLATEPVLLAEGESACGALLFALNHGDVDDFGFSWAEEAWNRERRYWNEFPLQPLRMDLPDPEVMHFVTACSRNILQAREIKDGLAEFQVGPTCYRGLWVVDGHFLLEAAQYLGHSAEAYRGIDALLRRVRPSGAIVEMEQHDKETGISLATIVRQCELMGDDERLLELWPTVRNAVRYIGELREMSKARGPQSPEYGLMPPSFGDGGLSGKRPEYTTALWTLAGLRSVWRAAVRLNQTDDAESFRAAYEDLLGAFREHAARDMQTLPDGTLYLPMLKPGGGEHTHIPDFSGTPPPWQRVNPATATWALAHAIYPGEVFEPNDPLVQHFCTLLDSIDDEEGMPAATGWITYQGIWNYSASFYAHVMLFAGRPQKAIDYLYAFANHASSTRVWREEQSLASSGYGGRVGDMPHNWASAEFIRLVRHLLVFERGEDLEIFPALPSEWVVTGRPIVVERTPTRFGPVSLRLDSTAHKDWSVTLELDEKWKRRPQRIVFHVPGGGEMNRLGIAVNGARTSVNSNGAVDLDFNAVTEIKSLGGATV